MRKDPDRASPRDPARDPDAQWRHWLALARLNAEVLAARHEDDPAAAVLVRLLCQIERRMVPCAERRQAHAPQQQSHQGLSTSDSQRRRGAPHPLRAHTQEVLTGEEEWEELLR